MALIATAAVFTGAFPVVAPPPPPIVGDLVGLYNGSTDGSAYAIGAITRTSGVWAEDAGNPVLQKGAGGAWDDVTVKDPWLMWDGSQYVMYYSGLDGTNYRIGRATADDVAGPWTKAGGNPVLGLGAGGAFDDVHVSFPVVLREAADDWKMWYTAFDGSKYTIGYAHSTDGIAWTKEGQVIDVGAGGSWNDVHLLTSGIIRVGATYYLFVGGAQDTGGNPRWQAGLYTFTDPEGTYTPSPSNPVLEARFNDAGTSQALTANTASGSPVVTVADTSAWHVNEPMVLDDGDSNPLVASIASIDSGTQITLDTNAATDYTTAQSAVIRPLAYNAVVGRSVWRSGSQWVMSVTPFQPLNDITSSHLLEGSMLATASGPDGPWALDYDTGLIVPLGSGWDANSAENLSVIPTP